MARHPGVKLELSVTERKIDLVREGYDIAVRIGPEADGEPAGGPLPDLPTVLVASPGYIARRGMPATIDELGRHACLRYLSGGRPAPIAFADGTALMPDGPLDTDDPGALRQAALHGAGIAHLLRLAVGEDLAAGRLVAVLPDRALASVPVRVLHAFGRQLPVRARLFVDFLLERIAAAAP